MYRVFISWLQLSFLTFLAKYGLAQQQSHALIGCQTFEKMARTFELFDFVKSIIKVKAVEFFDIF